MTDDVPNYKRSSRRITITLPFGVYSRLLKVSDREGRSLSNLCAFLVEHALGVFHPRQP